MIMLGLMWKLPILDHQGGFSKWLDWVLQRRRCLLIVPPPKSHSLILKTYIDADHASFQETRRSVTGIILMIIITVIHWYDTVTRRTLWSFPIMDKSCSWQVLPLSYILSSDTRSGCWEWASKDQMWSMGIIRVRWSVPQPQAVPSRRRRMPWPNTS